MIVFNIEDEESCLLLLAEPITLLAPVTEWVAANN